MGSEGFHQLIFQRHFVVVGGRRQLVGLVGPYHPRNQHGSENDQGLHLKESSKADFRSLPNGSKGHKDDKTKGDGAIDGAQGEILILRKERA